MQRIFLLLLIPLFTHAQEQATRFTDAEKQIISGGDTTVLLTVFQTTHPNGYDVLNAHSTDIDPADPLLPLLAQRMFYSVNDPNNQGVGIAAPQVGINRNLVWVQRFDKPEKPFEFFINPKIIWRSKLLQTGSEGDLSIPEFRDKITRSYVIQLAYYGLDGGFYTEMVEGFTAVIFQHEIDHLSGILISAKGPAQKDWELIRPERAGVNLSFKKDN